MSITAVEHPRPERGSPVIQWNGDGSYTPRCNVCDYTGKRRTDHAAARAACRQHAQSALHRARLKSHRFVPMGGVQAVRSVVE